MVSTRAALRALPQRVIARRSTTVAHLASRRSNPVQSTVHHRIASSVTHPADHCHLLAMTMVSTRAALRALPNDQQRLAMQLFRLLQDGVVCSRREIVSIEIRNDLTGFTALQ